jgi:hypothetical protein
MDLSPFWAPAASGSVASGRRICILHLLAVERRRPTRRKEHRHRLSGGGVGEREGDDERHHHVRAGRHLVWQAVGGHLNGDEREGIGLGDVDDALRVLVRRVDDSSDDGRSSDFHSQVTAADSDLGSGAAQGKCASRYECRRRWGISVLRRARGGVAALAMPSWRGVGEPKQSAAKGTTPSRHALALQRIHPSAIPIPPLPPGEDRVRAKRRRREHWRVRPHPMLR